MRLCSLWKDKKDLKRAHTIEGRGFEREIILGIKHLFKKGFSAPAGI